MPEGVVTALIAALSALFGAAVAHWGAARLQAQRLTDDAGRERGARLRQQRAECLGWVLEARVRMEALMPRLEGRKLSAVSADKTAAVAARQAYAVALLYLAAARPSARAFYRSSALLQMALSRPIAEDEVAAVQRLSASWHADYEALEALIAGLDEP